ncbi:MULTISPECIES: hypothetical protein [unclassified Streptosporangium]|uniref:hypothetical protein n=1 Tax=unclassified Streptosporangium TaxID=2632669 RepID=UPI002E28DD52|nr:MULTISPECIES: hypothetical protein [unclassified Streptosporangium]
MNYKKLAAVLLGSAAVTAALLTPATPASAQAGTAQTGAATTATRAATALVEQASVRCSKPSGKRANYSWGEGTTTVTIYFNNHCSHKVSVKISFERKGSSGPTVSTSRCMTVNANTKGSKKFYAARYKPYSVTRVSSC